MTRSLQKQLQEDMMKRYRKHCLDYDYETHVEKSALFMRHLHESMKERRQIVKHAACDRLVRVYNESGEFSEGSEG